MDAALDISQLEIGYKPTKNAAIKVAGPVDLSIAPGELVCLLGQNGAGKTTLLRTLAGILPPLSGKVSIHGKNVSEIHKKTLAQSLSVVLTDRIGHGNLTVYELISLGRTPHTGWFGSLGQVDQDKIQTAIAQTELQPLMHKSIHQISDGERQKVMIARALAQDTPVILLDEPTAHLDLPNRLTIIRLLRKLARETNKAIILSTHELDMALQAADVIWLMTMEKQMFSGTPEDLVLNDVFGDAFTKEGIAFDKSYGVFKVVEPHCEAIAVYGDEEGTFWTKRALERMGYEVVPERENVPKIHVASHNNSWKWECFFEHNTEIFHSVAELTQHLKAKGGHG